VRPSPIGWDTHDQQLDLLIDPDGSHHWKDEDQFAEVAAAGWYTPAEAALIRREAHAVLAEARSGDRPFNEGWPAWTPDPAWTIPQLSEGWDELEPALPAEELHVA
jgi:hypothetical protein